MLLETLVLTLTLAVPSHAADLTTLRQCADIENDIARLQCFDEAVTSILASLPESAAETDSSAETDVQEPDTKSKTPKNLKPTRPEDVQEADERMIANCRFLGSVLGKSGWGGLASGMGAKGTVKSAKKRAAKLGATHIVLGEFNNGSGVTMQATNRTARAYYCEDSTDE